MPWNTHNINVSCHGVHHLWYIYKIIIIIYIHNSKPPFAVPIPLVSLATSQQQSKLCAFYKFHAWILCTCILLHYFGYHILSPTLFTDPTDWLEPAWTCPRLIIRLHTVSLIPRSLPHFQCHYVKYDKLHYPKTMAHSGCPQFSTVLAGPK